MKLEAPRYIEANGNVFVTDQKIYLVGENHARPGSKLSSGKLVTKATRSSDHGWVGVSQQPGWHFLDGWASVVRLDQPSVLIGVKNENLFEVTDKSNLVESILKYV